MTTKHTPTPWRVVTRANQIGITVAWITDDQVTLDAPRNRAGTVDPKHLAALHAMAAKLNAHDELVAALTALLDDLDQLGGSTLTISNATCQVNRERARAALAKVEG